MRTRSTWLTAALLGISTGALVLGARPAGAQDIDPEEGGVYVPPGDSPGEVPPPPPPEENRPRAWYEGGPTGTVREEPGADGATGEDGQDSSGEPSGASDADDGLSDHARMVGRVAVGFMGSSAVPIGITSPAAPIDTQTVTAPALGIRYWFTELVGLDVGLGFGVLTGSVETGSTSIPTDDSVAFVVHAGVPIAVYHSSHYALLIIPEINMGYATGTVYGPTMDEDRGREGLLFQLGGRLGTEINFGFMDIPQLSLQASVGLYLDYSAVSVGANRAGTVEGVARNTFSFGTTVLGEPWDIFLGALTALYYF